MTAKAKLSDIDTTLCELERSGAKFVLIASNSTEYWREDIKKKAERILTYSLVNLTEPTHLCSADVNFPSQEVYNRFKKTDGFEEDEIAELENCVDNDCHYFVEREKVTAVRTWNGEETEDEIIEYLRGNPIEI